MDLFEQIRQREADKCKQQEIKVQQLKFVPNHRQVNTEIILKVNQISS